MGNVVCQPFQGDVLSAANSDLGARVQRRLNLIEDTQSLRFRHGVVSFGAVEQALMVHYIDMVLAVHIDGLAVFVDTGQIFAYRQLAQFFRNKLCGGVDLAVKLGGKVPLDIDDQAALGQVHGLGDLVGIAAVLHGVFRKMGGFQADICDFSGKGDGIARTSKPQHQNLRILLCAMPGGIDEVLPGIPIEPHRSSAGCEGRYMVRFGPFLVLRLLGIATLNDSILLARCVNQLVGFLAAFPFTQNLILLAQISIRVIEFQPFVFLPVVKRFLIHQQVPLVRSIPLGQGLRRAAGITFRLVVQENITGKLPVDGGIRAKSVKRSAICVSTCLLVESIYRCIVFYSGLPVVGNRLALCKGFKASLDGYGLLGAIILFLHNRDGGCGLIALFIAGSIVILPVTFLCALFRCDVRSLLFFHDGNLVAGNRHIQDVLHIFLFTAVLTVLQNRLLERVGVVNNVAVLVHHAKPVILYIVDFHIRLFVGKAGNSCICAIFYFLAVQQELAIAQGFLMFYFLLFHIDTFCIAVQAIHIVGVAIFVLELIEVDGLLGIIGVWCCETDTAILAFIGNRGGNLLQFVILNHNGFLHGLECSVCPGVVRSPGHMPDLGNAKSIVGKVGIQCDVCTRHFYLTLGLGHIRRIPEDVIQRGGGVSDCYAVNRLRNTEFLSVYIVAKNSVLPFDCNSQIGTQEVVESKVGAIGLNPDLIQIIRILCQEGIALGASIPVVAVVHFHRTVFNHQEAATEFFLVVYPLLGNGTQGIEFYRISVLLYQVVNGSVFRIAAAQDILKAGIQALYIVVLFAIGCKPLRLNQPGFPFHQLAAYVFGQADGHAVKQAHSFQPLLGHDLGQDFKGRILLYCQTPGEQVDGNTAAELDLLNLAIRPVDKLVVPHVGGNAVFHDPGNVAVFVRIDQRPIGQLVKVQVLCRVVSRQVPFQHVHALDDVVICQVDLTADHIIQGLGDGNGNGGGAYYPVNLSALFQAQVDITLHRLDIAQFYLDVLAGRLGVCGKFCYPFNAQTRYRHVNVTQGGYLDTTHCRILGENPGAELFGAAAHQGCTADHQGMRPQGADGTRCRPDLGNSRQCAAGLPDPGDGCRAVVNRDQARKPYTAGSGAGDCEFRGVLRMQKHIVRGTLAVNKHLGIYKAGIDIGHGLENQIHIRAIGNRQGREHGLVVNGQAGNAAVEVGVTWQVVCDIAESQGRTCLHPDLLLIPDAHLPHTALFRNIDEHTGGCITQIQGDVLDGNAAAALELRLITGMLADKSTCMLLVEDAVTGDFPVVDPDAGTLVDKVLDGDGCGFPGNDLALGVGMTNGVQLHPCIGMDVGIQIVRLRGGVDHGTIVADDRNVLYPGIGRQGNRQVVHGINVGPKSAALGVTVAVNIQLLEDGIDINIPALDHLDVPDTYIGIQLNCRLIVYIRGHAQAGAISGGIGDHTVLRCVGADGDGAKTVLDTANVLNIDLGRGFQGQIRLNLAQSHHAAGGDFCGGGDHIVFTGIGADAETTVICGEVAVLRNGDEATANQFVDGGQGTLGKESAAVCHGLSRHGCLGVGSNSQAVIRLELGTDGNGVVGGDVILTLGIVGVDGKANVRACGIGLGLGSIFRGEGDAALCRQNRSTGNAYIGAVPAVGGKACLGNSNTGNFRTLFHNGLGFACVVGPENDVLQRLNGAAGNSETHGLGLVAGCTHLGIGRCGRCVCHAYTTGLVGFGGGSGIADGLGLKGSVDFHASPCHCDRNHIPGGGIGNHRADGCQAQTLGQRCLGKRFCDGFGPGGKAAR